ncbi:MAG: DUF695 domain-containing protein [Thalassotalea sp.]
MRSITVISTLLISLIHSTSSLAKEQWWSYLSGQENGPSSTRVDLEINKIAPLADFPFVLITGVKFDGKSSEGLPAQPQIDKLNILQERLVKYVNSKLRAKYVGTFTYQSEQLHYIYVQDKMEAERVITKFYLESCIGCSTYSNVRHDPQWLGYKGFLYPSEQIIKHYGLSLEQNN